ncbi:MAG: tetratricopeptide repeat protein [Methanothrix sp.]|uniref:tetratricopeptide repeat protein n=1 Tax=Methanothrix sp. TaxID=90426 RepID=UPI003C78D6D5
MKTRFAIALLALAMLCASSLAQENTAEDWYKKGRDLAKNGSYEEAVFAYNRAIELEPNNATFYTAIVPNLNMLALTTNNQSKRNESLEAIDKALEIDPKNPVAWEQKGSMLSQIQRYNESLEAYDKAIENIDSYSQDAHSQTEFLSYTWTSKSISLWQLMRYNESLEAVDKAVQIDPAGNYDAWVFKGELLVSLGRYNESLQAFEGAAATETASSQPKISPLPWAAEGYVLMQMGRYEEADRIYQKIIDLNFTGEGADRSLAEAWRGRGNALAKLGKYNESLQAFDTAIELNAENAPYAWTGKSDALKDTGRYDEAIKAYDLALELYPEYADAGIARAQNGRGDALTRQGKSDEALAAYEAAVKASDEAISAFNNATPIDRAVSFTFDPYPLDGEFWHNRAFALHSIGRNAEAEESSAKATEMGYRPKMVTAVAGSGPIVTEKMEMIPEAEETGPRR